jgi:hypothetical protein
MQNYAGWKSGPMNEQGLDRKFGERKDKGQIVRRGEITSIGIDKKRY